MVMGNAKEHKEKIKNDIDYDYARKLFHTS